MRVLIMPAPAVNEEDRELMWGLFEIRDKLKQELDTLPDRIKTIKKELKSLTDLRIGEKFELDNGVIGRQHRIYKQSKRYLP
jgi:hypothetical protein